MTNQEKKRELQKYREAERDSVRLREEIIRLYSTAERTTTALKLVPGGGGGGNKIEAAVEAIDCLATQFGEKQVESVQIRRNIEDAIDTVTDWRLRELLRYRYIDGMKWEKIAERVGLERRQVTRLHGNALSLIDFL